MNPSEFKRWATNPVEKVSWDNAQQFCQKVSAYSHRVMRLPSEAEWEYACRAGTQTLFYSGDAESDLARVAWYNANSKGTTHPVGQKEPNAWGLYDMHGNVAEWCADWWTSYTNEPATDPAGPPQGVSRMLRGGVFVETAWYSRSAWRSGYNPGFRGGGVGFRVVVSMPRNP